MTDANKNGETPSNRNRSEYRLSVLALVVAVGTAGFTYMQYKVADKTRQQQHDDAMDTLKLSVRPYVSVQASLQVQGGYQVPGSQQPAPPFTEGSNGAQGVVTLTFTASGGSPALDAVVERRCIGWSPPTSTRGLSPPPEAWSRLTQAVSHSVLFPGGSVIFHCSASLAADDNFVFVVGQVKYADVFHNQHVTKFCFENTPDPGPAKTMLPCSDGNSME